jgi:hypothetical protein
VFWNENRAIPVHPARYLVERGHDARGATAEDILDIYATLIEEDDVGGSGSSEGEGCSRTYGTE